jgi:hypothetical protein
MINKKVARDKSLTKIASGNLASLRPTVSQSTSNKPIICLKCGEPGHKSPDRPKNKQGGTTTTGKQTTTTLQPLLQRE